MYLAAPPPAVTEQLVLDREGGHLAVQEMVVVHPPHPRLVIPLLPGAQAPVVVAGTAVLVGHRLVLAPDAGPVQVNYQVPFGPRGLAAPWPVTAPVSQLLVLTGRGVSLPLITNQALSGAGQAALNDQVYRVAGARNLRPGTQLVLNFVYAAEDQSPVQQGLWAGVVGGSLLLVSLLLGRRKGSG